MKKIAFVFSLLVLCFAGEGVFAATHTVAMNNLSFEPRTITVIQGESVEWTNVDARLFGGIPHTTTSGTGCIHGAGWDSGTLYLGESFAVTFDRPGTYDYFCTLHCGSSGMTGTVIVNPAVMSLPVGTELIAYAPVADPAVSSDPFQSMPIGIGPYAEGGSTVTIRIRTASFEEPVDVYFAIGFAGTFSILTPTGFQTLEDAGLVPWMTNVTDYLDLAPFDSIPVSDIPRGDYALYLGVAPADPPSGDFPLYIWETVVSIPSPASLMVHPLRARGVTESLPVPPLRAE